MVYPGRIEMTTEPFTDLWQNTYVKAGVDTSSLLQVRMRDETFSFFVRTEFDMKHVSDQCGIVIYLDSENWLKAFVECGDDTAWQVGSVVTNAGWSDWAAEKISPGLREMWYRLDRRGHDYRVCVSFDGTSYEPIRVFHLWDSERTVPVGMYACSPGDSSFQAAFTDIHFEPCEWPDPSQEDQAAQQ